MKSYLVSDSNMSNTSNRSFAILVFQFWIGQILKLLSVVIFLLNLSLILCYLGLLSWLNGCLLSAFRLRLLGVSQWFWRTHQNTFFLHWLLLKNCPNNFFRCLKLFFNIFCWHLNILILWKLLDQLIDHHLLIIIFT